LFHHDVTIEGSGQIVAQPGSERPR
jgi:hypothetical protein